MALARWEPLGFEWPKTWRNWLDLDAGTEHWLRVEETEEDGSLVIRAELPGIDPDKDVEISVSGEVLHISAKREESHEKEESGIYRSEFRYGQFSRDLPLPSGVDAKSVKAGYQDGILEIKVPWAKAQQAKSIKVPIGRP